MLAVGNFTRLFIKTVIALILVRLLTKDAYGSYRQLFLIYQTISSILFLGLPQSLLYFVPRLMGKDESSLRKILTQTFTILLGLGILFSVGTLALRTPIGSFLNNPELPSLLVFFFLYPLFMFISQFYQSALLGFERSGRAAFFGVLSTTMDAVFILGTAWLTRDLRWIVIGMVVSAALQWLYAQVSLRKIFKPDFRFDGSLLREQLDYAVPLGLVNILGLLATQIDKVVVSSYFTPDVFAVFSIGATEIPLISVLIVSVNNILLPSLTRMDPEKDRKQIEQIYSGATRKNALIIFPIVIFFFIFARDFLVMLYSSKYAGAEPYFRIYLLILFLRIATMGVLLKSYGLTKFMLLSSCIVLVLNVILNIVLINIIGITGPAWATVIITYMLFSIYLWIIYRKLGFSVARLFSFGNLLRTLILSVGVGIPFWFLIPWSLNPWIKFPGLFIAYTGIYYLLGRLFGVIKDYDRDILVEAIRKFGVKR